MYTTYTDSPDTPQTSNITNALYTSIPSYTTSDHVRVSYLISSPPDSSPLTIPMLPETGCRCPPPSVPCRELRGIGKHTSHAEATPSLLSEPGLLRNHEAVHRQGVRQSDRLLLVAVRAHRRGLTFRRHRELCARPGDYEVVDDKQVDNVRLSRLSDGSRCMVVGVVLWSPYRLTR